MWYRMIVDKVHGFLGRGNLFFSHIEIDELKEATLCETLGGWAKSDSGWEDRRTFVGTKFKSTGKC